MGFLFEDPENDLDCFMDRIDRGMLKMLAKAMYRHKEVVAFGSVYSQNVAMDFMYRMADEGKYIRTYTYDTRQEEYLRNMNEDTLVIISRIPDNICTETECG